MASINIKKTLKCNYENLKKDPYEKTEIHHEVVVYFSQSHVVNSMSTVGADRKRES